MRYKNYTNVNREVWGLRGYQPGDQLTRGHEGDIDGYATSFDELRVLAERVFEKHNRDDRPDGQVCPSMSVGDVVVFGEVAMTVMPIGFAAVNLDPADVLDVTWRDHVHV